MKHIIINVFFLFLSPLLQSMEIVPSKKTLQEDECFSGDCSKRAMVRHMSHKLMLLNYVAAMPQDIWQQIYTKMVDSVFEGDKEFEESFYNKPSSEAFQLYHDIKNVIEKNKPIARLYKMPQEERNNVLGKIRPWYCPVMSVEDCEQINEFDDDIKQYFTGRTMLRLPDAHIQSTMHRDCIFFTAEGCLVWVLMNLVAFSSIGFCVGFKLATSPTGLWLSVGLSSGCAAFFFMVGLCSVMYKCCKHSERVTL
jgi:hypothetical protein